MRKKLVTYVNFVRLRYPVLLTVILSISFIAGYGNLALMSLAAGILLGFGMVFRGLSLILERLNPIETGPSTVKQITANVYALIKLNERFPSLSPIMNTWSIEPVHLQYLISLLDEHQPKRIVELGCGVSTLLVAAWLKENGGGQCVSFDHSEQWANRSKLEARRVGLQDFMDIRVAPLCPQEIQGRSISWYDASIIKEGKEKMGKIDLLLIDGPPSATPMARMPAVPVFYETLSESALVVLDDGNRPGEREAVNHWLRVYPDLVAELVSSATGLWVLRRRY